MPQRFGRLIRRGFLTPGKLEELQEKAGGSGRCLEDAILEAGVPKHEILFCLAEHFGCPVVEYEENLMISASILRRMDAERLKSELWLPVSILEDRAEVIACWPDDPELNRRIRETLGVKTLGFLAATRADLIRIIENNWDLNPDFPPSAGRTPLAKVRTYLADRRSAYAAQRTAFAKGRTGLAFLRTGLAFITISVTFLRLFGAGWLLAMEVPLIFFGIAAVWDGLLWYLPARRESKSIYLYPPYDIPEDFSALEASNPGDDPRFARSRTVGGAGLLRNGWDSLSPVERRRFLASDRTDLAEERTILAFLRTGMAKARMGLSFTRTGVAFTGIGIGFLRQFGHGSRPFHAFMWALISAGVAMIAEGFHWYLPGRGAGRAGLESIKRAGRTRTIWDRVFPMFSHFSAADGKHAKENHPSPAVCRGQSPGVWATTGLALERTLLADRRNIMARLRTVMARSRTGMAFIRTGLSISAVGAGLFIYFGGGNIYWAGFDLLLVAAGLYLTGDGIYWLVPAEREKKQFPYCFGDFEIQPPDYRLPCASWKRVFFSHDR